MRKHPIVALVLGVALFGICRTSQAQSDSELPQAVYLYDGDAPGSEGMSDISKQVRPGSDRVVTQVHRPLMYPYLPAEGTETRMAVIIAPGGGHNSLWSTHEGHTPAKYFAEHGIAAFVLEYRLAEEKGSKYTVDEHALGDLQRGIRLIRARAEDWKIDPSRVGVMGFSAGGEIAALSGMRFDAGDENAEDQIAKQSSRPDFVALIYPGRSHRYEPKPETPPTFIAAGFGDRRDISKGMAEVYLKYKRAGVPTELHIYSNAGHGFGLREGKSGSVMKWVDRFIDWAGDRKLLGKDTPTAAIVDDVTIEDGGTGPYSVIASEDASLPGMTIFRPRDLSPFGKDQKLPILLWGNGACANTTQEHKNFLSEIASHGYVVLAIGLLDQIENRDETSRQKTQSSQLLRALDWIIAENDRPDSLFVGKVDAAKVAAMGMSCGGLQAIEISPDPRISTTVVCNSGVLPDPSPLPGMPALKKDILTKLHAPVLYIMGGPSDIAYKNAMDDFSQVNHVPIAMTNFDVGHAGTYARPHGGEFTPVALAWLDWQLKRQMQNSKVFLGAQSKLAKDPNWTVETKNFQSSDQKASNETTAEERRLGVHPPTVPDGWSDGYLYANGVRLHYYHALPAANKPPLIMVHGITDNGLCWTTLALKLQDDYDIYMLDARGHGLSDPFTTSDDADTLIKDVKAAVEALGLKQPILMGHSMGANTVIRLGAEYPDLAKAVIMLDPLLQGAGNRGRRGPRGSAPRGGEDRREDGGEGPGVNYGQQKAEVANNEQTDRPAPKRLSVSMFGSPEALVAQNNYSFDDLVAKCRRDSPKWDLLDCQYWALSKKQYHGAYASETFGVMTGAMQIGDALTKIRVPALVLKADASDEDRKAHQQTVSTMLCGKIVHIDDAGHNLHHDQLDRTFKVLSQFLSALSE